MWKLISDEKKMYNIVETTTKCKKVKNKKIATS